MEEVKEEKLEEVKKDSSSVEKKKKGHSKKDQIRVLEDKIKELEDKNLRDKAELINFKKRQEETTSRMMKYANEDLIKELLVYLDNFERAIQMDDDNLEDEVSKFLSGFKMMYCDMGNMLKKYGVEEINAMNEAFDPTKHQAVLTEHRDGVAPGVVIEVLQKGYLYKDKVIRPSMVKVSE